jgi:hypothetical protein
MIVAGIAGRLSVPCCQRTRKQDDGWMECWMSKSSRKRQRNRRSSFTSSSTLSNPSSEFDDSEQEEQNETVKIKNKKPPSITLDICPVPMETASSSLPIPVANISNEQTSPITVKIEEKKQTKKQKKRKVAEASGDSDVEGPEEQKHEEYQTRRKRHRTTTSPNIKRRIQNRHKSKQKDLKEKIRWHTNGQKLIGGLSKGCAKYNWCRVIVCCILAGLTCLSTEPFMQTLGIPLPSHLLDVTHARFDVTQPMLLNLRQRNAVNCAVGIVAPLFGYLVAGVPSYFIRHLFCKSALGSFIIVLLHSSIGFITGMCVSATAIGIVIVSTP